VNTNATEPKELKEIMDKEKLNWRSFVTQDTVKAKWDDPGTPMYYVIDHRGVIRYKWFGSPGEKAIDTAVETLIEKVLTKDLSK
jgi:hypothetical protein